MRLIDADKLIDYFYFGVDDKPIIDGISDRKIIDIIKNQPTAYSVEKVIQELEKRKQEYLDVDGFIIHVNNELYDIVKHGGVRKDVE